MNISVSSSGRTDRKQITVISKSRGMNASEVWISVFWMLVIWFQVQQYNKRKDSLKWQQSSSWFCIHSRAAASCMHHPRSFTMVSFRVNKSTQSWHSGQLHANNVTIPVGRRRCQICSSWLSSLEHHQILNEDHVQDQSASTRMGLPSATNSNRESVSLQFTQRDDLNCTALLNSAVSERQSQTLSPMKQLQNYPQSIFGNNCHPDRGLQRYSRFIEEGGVAE